ncbi:MAG TPA: hypothetical protein VED43_00475, partial [Mycobacterium sp.]|nr:hypothetical protein [Mycobacterium sp.]
DRTKGMLMLIYGIAAFVFNPLIAASFPELETTVAHLRNVLGDQTYESLARKGEAMTTAAIARYAYDQIDQASELHTSSAHHAVPT